MDPTSIIGMALGVMGFVFGLSAFTRVDQLEKKLKELEVLPATFKSDE